MDEIYFSKIRPDFRNRDARGAMSDIEKLHKLLMSAFPDFGGQGRQKTNLLFRAETDGYIIASSTVKPDWSLLGPGFMVEGIKVLDLSTTQFAGADFAFRLVANPTYKKSGSKDVVPLREYYMQDFLDKYKMTKDPPTVLEWMERKANNSGFQIRQLSVVGLNYRPDGPSRRSINFKMYLFEGQLRVVDVPLFARTLKTGIGREKAFGCGLLSIAPARG
ncbi:MAG: type I-E CRISPR-associated protein Cas6/Cse3/CasE [Caldisericales bacterium]|nr:type I-E CRISPR-associated protein Cas6/Cse3/CasE [Caldisericales bacterium]